MLCHNKFRGAYWQIPLNPSSYDACGIISLQGVFTSTPVLQRLKNAAAHFQAQVLQGFHSMQDAFQSCGDDLIIFAKSIEEILERLDKFLSIYDEQNLKDRRGNISFIRRESDGAGEL